MPLLIPCPRSRLASPLRPRSSSPAVRGGFLPCPRDPGARRRLHAVLAANSRVVLGCGLVTLDYLATVDAYPRPDDKIRTGELQISGGGNAGNALTAAARLGLNTRLISKVANDETGGTVLSGLRESGIDTSHVIISDGGNTTVVYIIIDKQTKTRTCILTPEDPPMIPSDLSMSSLSAALQDVSLLYLDGYSPEMGLAVAKQGDQMKIPILVDAEQERTKEELEDLLSLASYIVCSGKFPKNWTSIPSLPCALLGILLQYPRANFIIVTLGENGCVMLERSEAGDDSGVDAADIEDVAESLKLELHKDDVLPTCVSSKHCRQRCLPRRCSRLHLKWRASNAERSVHELAFRGDLINGWLSSYERRRKTCVRRRLLNGVRVMRHVNVVDCCVLLEVITVSEVVNQHFKLKV